MGNTDRQFPAPRRGSRAALSRLIAFFPLSILLASCGGGGGDGSPSAGPPPPHRLVSIAITPATPSVAKGATQQLKATGTFSDTSTGDLTNSVSWSSGTPAIATVNASSGLVQTVTVGSTVITATSDTISASITLNVTAATLEAIAVTPNPAFSGVGLTSQLAATGTYTDGSTADVTNLAIWTSGTTSIATIGAGTGLATGVSLGSTTISAAIGSLSASAPLSITSNLWHPAGSLASHAHCLATATLLPDGRVLEYGGSCRLGTTTASGEIYDPVTNTWPQVTYATARYGHTATLLPNGKVLVVGGQSTNSAVIPPTYLASAELFDPVTGMWSPAASLSTSRSDHSATLLPNGKVLVAGGISGFTVLVSMELYDPATNTWSPAADMPALNSPTATLLQNGKVLFTGIDANAATYDPTTNTWSPAGTMTVARDGYTATLLANGKVLVAGGIVNSGSAELYDPVTNTWSTAASMSTGRLGHTATVLQSGKVLVAGGQISGGTTGSAELYDPTTNTWSPAGTLETPRYGQTATLLQSGVVLVAGGDTVGVNTQNSCELYW